MKANVERMNVECVDPVHLCAFYRRRAAADPRSCVDIAVDCLEPAVVRAGRLGGMPIGGIDRSGERPFQVMEDPEGNVFRFLAR
ncbi:hypothetical protein K2224_18080 [Streptomyces sp. BHT-5-2]|uniref:VOC family protein n=1 Tax=Streptomyces sp. BHT-5-2 TaxID=2866715 RepID=UPI001C8E603C|nr:VOC family protein [Streptomyces sp. BHT-5-2]QZL04816.1 hypothetical protein K2224_18080 [Streptomyces sp. BHT-5-2]